MRICSRRMKKAIAAGVAMQRFGVPGLDLKLKKTTNWKLDGEAARNADKMYKKLKMRENRRKSASERAQLYALVYRTRWGSIPFTRT